MIRITSGSAKNKKLKIPNIERFRGVQEKAKLAIFSIIGQKIIHSNCLDLFAGSGNLGIEALSRGASWCDFVDNHKLATRIIEENLTKCDLEGKAEVFCEEAAKYAANASQKYDIIFIDPFYDDLKHRFLIKNVAEILKEEGIVVFTHGKELDIKGLIEDTVLELQTQRRFGRSYVSILAKL